MNEATLWRRMRKVLLAMFAAAVGVDCLQAETIAFYPFDEGASGSSALSTDLLNSVDSTKFKGASTATYSGLSGVKFSDDVPGAYLFDGSGFKESPYVASFGSIEVWGRKKTDGSGAALNDTSSASVSFGDLAKELSTNDSWTVEFFHKPAVEEFCAGGKAKLIAFDSGLSVRNVGGVLSVYFPTASGDGLRGKMDDNASPGGSTLFNLTSSLDDMRGSWNHFALTYDGPTGVMKLYHNHVQKKSDTFSAGTAPEEGAAVLFANGAVRGKYCAFRVSDKALNASEMLYASDNPTQVDRLVWDLPLEGVPGAAVSSGNAYVDTDGVQPRYVARRQMKIVESGVGTGITSNAVQLTVTPKSSGSAVFATGPGLKVLKSSVEVPLDGSFTMEGYFKLDKASWEGKVIDVQGEARKRVTIMGQKWITEGRNQLWSLAFEKSNDGYRPRIDCTCNVDGTATAVTRNGSTLLSLDGKWHRYVVRYSQPTCTFDFYEDDSMVFQGNLPGDLFWANQGNWLVGTQLGSHPFEGQVDSLRLSRGVLPPNAFRTMERVPTGFCITFR